MNPQQKIETIERYQELGLRSSMDARLAAAKVAILMTFATDWSSPKVASWMSTAATYLEAFCGDKVYNQAIDELDFSDFDERKLSRDVAHEIIKDMKAVFPYSEAPNRRSYWAEAIRHTRMNLL